MLKKTITYVDYNGVTRTEDFYFNLTKAEIVEMEYGIDGGMKQLLEKIVNEMDMRRLMENFKTIVLKAYGVKSPDGKRFIKNQEVVDSFVQTEAYSELVMELLSSADNAKDFINAVIPKVEDNEKQE